MPARQTCWCGTCKTCYAREWARRRYRLKAYGQWQPEERWADIAPVRQHLLDLQAAGVGADAIAKHAQVGRQTVQKIRNGTQGRVSRPVADRLLAVTSKHADKLPVWPVARRLQALNALGYTARRMATDLGFTEEVLSDLLGGKRTYVLRPTTNKVAAYYEARHMTPGGNTFSVNSARRRGYLPPLAWDDIDDPNEQPRLGRVRRSTAA